MNPVKGEAPLVLSDGRELTLVFGAGGLIHAESVSGKPTAQIMAEASRGFLGSMSALLCGALQKFHPGFTLEEAADIALAEGDNVRHSLDAAAALAFPDPDPKATEGKDGPNPLGNPSGNNGAPQDSTRTPSLKRRPARSV